MKRIEQIYKPPQIEKKQQKPGPMSAAGPSLSSHRSARGVAAGLLGPPMVRRVLGSALASRPPVRADPSGAVGSERSFQFSDFEQNGLGPGLKGCVFVCFLNLLFLGGDQVREFGEVRRGGGV